MAVHVEPEEVQAILEAMGHRSGAGSSVRASQVAPRDFTRPLRLSPADLEHWKRAAEGTLPEAGRELSRLLRQNVAIELAQVLEVSAEDVIASFAPPLAAARFEVEGQTGWIVWRPGPAACAVEIALGACEPPAHEERALTSVEREMLGEILGPLARRVAAGMGCDLRDPRTVQDVAQLGTWEDGGAAADPQRVHLCLAIHGPGGPSTIDLYLPGLAPVEGDEDPLAGAPLPAHLGDVDAELSAHLGEAEIPLDDLLALEVGDVIALGTPQDGLLRVLVEGVECAAARLGLRAGRLTLRIERAGRAPRNHPTPPRAPHGQ